MIPPPLGKPPYGRGKLLSPTFAGFLRFLKRCITHQQPEAVAASASHRHRGGAMSQPGVHT